MQTVLALALLASAAAMPQQATRVASATTPAFFAQQRALAPAPAIAVARAPIIPVLRRNEVHDEAGQYALGYETGNGIIVEEQGALRKNLDGEFKDDVVLVKRGSFSYPGPDGRTYRVEYTADETGFHPTGAHLPVAPSA